MRLLITGATGFIGKNLIELSLKKGYDIIATSSNLKTAKRFSWFNKVKYIEHDIHSEKNDCLFDKFKKPDTIIHLAWKGLPDYNKPFHVEKNMLAQMRFLRSFIDNGVKNMLIAGTCLEYGLREGSLKEDDCCDPNTFYAIAKDTLRRYLFNINKTNKTNLYWVRTFYLYGDNQPERTLFGQLHKSIKEKQDFFNMSEGDQKRDFLEIRTYCDYLLKIVNQNKTTGIINCCSGIPTPVYKLVKQEIDRLQSKIKINRGFYKTPDYEPFAFWGDNKKLKSILYEK